jgi:hypothetical protein
VRYALISDLHANLPATEAVLGDIARQDADAVYHLGDLVGYAPWPKQVVELLSARGRKTAYPTRLRCSETALEVRRCRLKRPSITLGLHRNDRVVLRKDPGAVAHECIAMWAECDECADGNVKELDQERDAGRLPSAGVAPGGIEPVRSRSYADRVQQHPKTKTARRNRYRIAPAVLPSPLTLGRGIVHKVVGSLGATIRSGRRDHHIFPHNNVAEGCTPSILNCTGNTQGRFIRTEVGEDSRKDAMCA